MRYESKYHRMTTRALRKEINNMVSELNQRISEYNAEDGNYEAFDRIYSELREIGGGASRKYGGSQALGRGYRMKKDELISYADELQNALSWGAFTGEGKQKWKDARDKAWKQFKKISGRESITKADFNRFTDLFERVGALNSGFDSKQIVELYNFTKANVKGVGIVKFGDLMEEVINESKGKGLDVVGLTQRIKDLLVERYGEK